MNEQKIIYNTHNTKGIMSYINNFKNDFKIIVTRNKEIDGRLNCGAGWDIYLKDSHKAYRTQYNNSKMNKEKYPKADDILDCIISDALAYLDTKTFYNFCREFGYSIDIDENPENRNIARQAFQGCKKAAERMSLIFTQEEMRNIADKLWA